MRSKVTFQIGGVRYFSSNFHFLKMPGSLRVNGKTGNRIFGTFSAKNGKKQ